MELPKQTGFYSQIKMKLGTGVSRAEDVTGFIDLKEPRETLKITSVSINDDSSVRVMSVLDTSTIDRAFEARELGLRKTRISAISYTQSIWTARRIRLSTEMPPRMKRLSML